MRRWRFTLFDLFVITLGVAVGLGYSRLPGTRWAEAMLVSCMLWIVVGMVQHARNGLAVWRACQNCEPERRHGAALSLARPVAVIAMVGAARL